MPPPSRALKTAALVLCGLGVALHLYTALFKAEGGMGAIAFLLGLFLWSCSPYAIAAALSRGRFVVWGLGAAGACLAADLFMHYAVFIAPKGSTAALGLLFMPLWNLLAIGPAGALLFWLVHRVFRHAPRATPPPPTRCGRSPARAGRPGRHARTARRGSSSVPGP